MDVIVVYERLVIQLVVCPWLFAKKLWEVRRRNRWQSIRRHYSTPNGSHISSLPSSIGHYSAAHIYCIGVFVIVVKYQQSAINSTTQKYQKLQYSTNLKVC